MSDLHRFGLDAHPNSVLGRAVVEGDEATLERIKFNMDEDSETRRQFQVNMTRRVQRDSRFEECPICEEIEYLVWDHDHSRENEPGGGHRGYVCRRCNSRIERVKDDSTEESLRIAYNVVAYLEAGLGRMF